MNNPGSNVRPLRVALVGFGNAGRIFHAPLIASVPDLVLHTVVSSKGAEVKAEWPQVRVVSDLAEACADPEVDLVVIATGNDSHYTLAHAALSADKHVVVDKPCTVTLEETQTLLRLAQSRQRHLVVFQNRRWDADVLGLREALLRGDLGRVTHFESHFDRYRPAVPDRWREKNLPGSGLWFDLGSHLVDQALQLFGLPQDLLLDLGTHRDGAEVNDYFHAVLRYPHLQGLRVILHGSTLVAGLGPRFAVHGTHGSFIKYGLDTQEDALKTGARPVWRQAGWGVDPQPARIVRQTTQGMDEREVEMPLGNYPEFYAQVAAGLRGTAPMPVTPMQIEQAMRILTLGELSFRRGAFIAVSETTEATARDQ